MLKIKDNVDLKELEKFGFDDEHTDSYYYYYEATWCIIEIRIEKSTRIIKMFVCTGDEDCSVSTEDVSDMLFDLIQAGLVEKVVE